MNENEYRSVKNTKNILGNVKKDKKQKEKNHKKSYHTKVKKNRSKESVHQWH
jgi:hypothetical protein